MQILDFKAIPVRAAAILTTSYVAGTVIENAQKFNKLSLAVDFTKGSLTDTQIKIETSIDGTTYRTLTVDAFTAGVSTPVALVYKFAANAAMQTVPVDVTAKYIKISAIGTGTVTSSSLAINAILSRD